MSDDSDQSFKEAVEEIRQTTEPEEENDDSQNGPSPQAQWGIVAGVFLVGGIFGAISNPSDPVSGFLVIGLISGGVAWAFATESGRIFREEFMENMEQAQQQQQQNTSNSKPKVICSNCGWKNPKGNNYCHDCGEELTS